MLRLAIFLTILLSAGNAQSFTPPETVKVYWLSPRLETYLPVTKDTIEEASSKIIELRNWTVVHETLRLIMASTKKLDPMRVRVKIQTNNQTYYFDSTGRGLSSNGKAVYIDLRRLNHVFSE